MSCKGTQRIEERQRQMELDAKRWNALINSPYMHLYGYAGEVGKEISHCGVAFTSSIKDEDIDKDIVVLPTSIARKVLLTYVDTILKAQEEGRNNPLTNL